MTNFIPHTPDERAAMLEAIGVASVEDLFSVIPASLRTEYTLNALPRNGQSEPELQEALTTQSEKNAGARLACFAGGGAYQRFIPPAVNAIASRSEFYTAYTPYQPEISQGTLQMIYEFQTMMSELTGLEVTNASVYDAATAVAESAFMAFRATRRKVLYVSQTLNPHFQQVLATYTHFLGDVTVKSFDPYQPLDAQLTDPANAVAGILVQQPDYFGTIQELTALEAFCRENGALLIASVDPTTLGLLEPPAADIICGDIQPFGNPVNYGGPYGGFLSTGQKLLRQLPGRLVGRTVDKDGKTAYTLTLQTREQHIRREKATSNICTNQSLNILKASAYLSLVGPQGLRQVALVSAERAQALAKKLTRLPGVRLRNDQPFLYEFAVTLPCPAGAVISEMASRHDILAGIDVSRYWPDEAHTLLVAVTELNTWETIARYVEAMETVLATLSEQTGCQPAESGRETQPVGGPVHA